MTEPPPKPVYDQNIANKAAAIDQCLKLGAVILADPKKKTGFK